MVFNSSQARGAVCSTASCSADHKTVCAILHEEGWYSRCWFNVIPSTQVFMINLTFFLCFLLQSSLLLNCQASRKPWRASQMTTLFISLLCFPSFLCAAVSVIYTIWTWVQQTVSPLVMTVMHTSSFNTERHAQIPQPQTHIDFSKHALNTMDTFCSKRIYHIRW